jgi:hypothetical protein
VPDSPSTALRSSGPEKGYFLKGVDVTEASRRHSVKVRGKRRGKEGGEIYLLELTLLTTGGKPTILTLRRRKNPLTWTLNIPYTSGGAITRMYTLNIPTFRMPALFLLQQ